MKTFYLTVCLLSLCILSLSVTDSQAQGIAIVSADTNGVIAWHPILFVAQLITAVIACVISAVTIWLIWDSMCWICRFLRDSLHVETYEEYEAGQFEASRKHYVNQYRQYLNSTGYRRDMQRNKFFES